MRRCTSSGVVSQKKGGFPARPSIRDLVNFATDARVCHRRLVLALGGNRQDKKRNFLHRNITVS